MVSPVGLVLLGAVALSIGRFPVSVNTLLSINAELFGWPHGSVTAVDRTVMPVVRFRGVVVAMPSGSALATSGAALQGVFRNPLVSPGILGVPSGEGGDARRYIAEQAGIEIVPTESENAAEAVQTYVTAHKERV